MRVLRIAGPGGGAVGFRARMIERTVRELQVGAEEAEGVAGVQRETA
jgi:hypothetical protein